MKHRMLFLISSVMAVVLFSASPGSAERPMDSASGKQGESAQLPKGVIGVALDVGAERIGDPAVLYVAMVNPEGPAQQAGLAHGDEIQSVDGTPVAGKTYEQVAKMIRGEPGAPVKLKVKGEKGVRELTVTRVAADQLPRVPKGSHGGQAR